MTSSETPTNENALEAITLLDSVLYLMEQKDCGAVPLDVDMPTVTKALLKQAKTCLEGRV
ncbi:MAG: hypothetical protein ABW116_08560 [Candidatus Sedimenticola sp. 20ELBAFRAG]